MRRTRTRKTGEVRLWSERQGRAGQGAPGTGAAVHPAWAPGRTPLLVGHGTTPVSPAPSGLLCPPRLGRKPFGSSQPRGGWPGLCPLPASAGRAARGEEHRAEDDRDRSVPEAFPGGSGPAGPSRCPTSAPCNVPSPGPGPASVLPQRSSKRRGQDGGGSGTLSPPHRRSRAQAWLSQSPSRSALPRLPPGRQPRCCGKARAKAGETEPPVLCVIISRAGGWGATVCPLTRRDGRARVLGTVLTAVWPCRHLPTSAGSGGPHLVPCPVSFCILVLKGSPSGGQVGVCGARGHRREGREAAGTERHGRPPGTRE